jgi:hypothetical protein
LLNLNKLNIKREMMQAKFGINHIKLRKMKNNKNNNNREFVYHPRSTKDDLT